MSGDVCVRISSLEIKREVDSEKVDKVCGKIETMETRQTEILNLLLKIKFTAYGAFGLMIIDKVGIITLFESFFK